MKSPKFISSSSLRPRPIASVTSRSSATAVLDGPIFSGSPRKPKFLMPAIALFAGVAILTTAPSGRAAVDAVKASPTTTGAGYGDLSVGTNYTTTITPTAATTTDVNFAAATTYSVTTFDANGAALSFGSLDDLDTTQALTLTNSSATAATLTLNLGSTNATAGSNAADLLFVGSGANLSIAPGSAGGLTLLLNNNGNIDNAGTLSLGTAITIAAGDTISFTGAGTTTVGGAIGETGASGAVTINDAGGSVTFSGANTYSGLTTVSAGTLTLNGTNTSAGNTTLSGGTLRLGNTTANDGGLASGLLTLNGGTLQAISAAPLSIGNTVSLTGASTISGAQSLTFTGAFGGTGGSLAITNSGATTITGAATYTGQTTVGNGTLSFAPATAGVNDSLGALAFNLGGGTVNSTYQGTGTTTLTFSNLLARTAGATGNFTLTGGANGSTNSIVLTQVGGATPTAGTLLDRGIFFGGNAYATVDSGGFLRAFANTDTAGGATTAGAGASTITTGSTNNVFVTGAITAQNSASVNTINLGGNGTTANGITLASAQTLGTNGILANGAATITGGTGLQTTTAGAELVIRENAGNLTISTPILNNTGTALTTSGPGTVTLSSTNTYTGATTVGTGSTLAASVAGAFGPSTNTAGVAVDGTLNFTGGAATYTFGGAVTGAGVINVTLGSAGNTTQLGNATTQLSGFTGTLNVNEGGTAGGKLQIAPNLAASSIVVAPNATLYLNGSGTTAAAISLGGGTTGETFGQLRTGSTDTFNGPITLTGTVTGANNSTITAFGNTDTFNGAIGQSGGAQSLLLGGSGSGSVVLTNTNTYTGPTIVGVGTATNNIVSLTLSGAGSDASSSYTINAGNTFQLTPGATNTSNMFTSASAPTITLNGPGAVLALTGNTTNSVTETFGSLALNPGYDTVSITGAAGKTTTLVAGATSNSFTRTSLATGLILGTNLGQGGTGNAAFTLGDGGASLTFVGTTTLNGASSSDATQTVKIVPYLFGGTPGTAGSNFVTYDTTNGFRTLTGSEDTALVAGSTTATNPVNATVTANTTLTASSLTVNSLLFTNSPVTLNGTNTTLTINSGALAESVNTDAIGTGFTSLLLGNGEGVITTPQGDTLTINAPINVTSSGGVTKTGNGTLILGTATSIYTGPTTVNQGTLQVNAGANIASSSNLTVTSGTTLTNSGTVGAITTNSGGTATLNGGSTTGAITDNGTVTIAGTTAVTTGNFSGSGATGLINYTNTLAGGNTLNFSGTNSFLELNNTAAGGLLTLTGVGSVNTFALFPEANAGLTTTATTFASGTYTFTAGGSNVYQNNLGTFKVAGANVIFSGGLRFAEGGGGTITVSGGLLETFTNFDTNQQASGSTINYNVTGGVFDVATSGANIGNESGKTSATTDNLTISGAGLFQVGMTSSTSTQNITIGGSTQPFVNATVALQAGGTIRDNGTIQAGGTLGASSTNNFNWTGGTLTALAVNMTNLTDNDGITTTPVAGTLYNGGGTLAPGYFGQTVGSAFGSANAQFTGKTTITGNYQVDSANAALAINIGNTTAATGFGASAANYDTVSISGTASFGTTAAGKLNVGLINSYTPPSNVTQLYNIVTGPTALSGTFSNLVTGNSATTTGGTSRVVLANGLSSMLVGINTTGSTATTDGLTSVPARTISLGGYQATNTYNAASNSAWDAANAADWTNFDPGSTATPATQASGAIAQFADGAATGTGAVAVTLSSTRNIQGIQFSSATSGHNYTINNGGSGAIILDNTANGTVATISDTSASGNVNAVNVPVTLNSATSVFVSPGNTLTLGGSITGGNVALTKNGGGTLVIGSTSTSANFTGPVNVSTGIMLVNGSLGATTGTPAGLTTVSSGATLGGTGILTVTSASVAGTLAPGATVGAATGALTLNTTGGIALSGTLQIGITAAGGTFLTTNGALALSGATLNVTGTSGASAYDIANYGSETGTFSSANIPTGYTLNYAGTTFNSGGDIELDMTAVPEPSTWVGALLMILGAVGIKFRRRKVQVG